MNLTTVRANGVELCVGTFGRAADPPVLLVGGATWSMDWWDDEFCALLAAGARHVIRYDHRDTGRSTSYPPGRPTYTGDDLTTDVLGLLDALDLPSAHLVGLSMGGGIGQQLALEHPDRVATLTLIATSPIGPPAADRPTLPSMDDRLLDVFDRPEPDWTDRAAVVEYIVESERPFAGSRSFDEEAVRALAGRIVDRTRNIASSMTNHGVVVGAEDDGGSTGAPVSEISVPTLVLHGTEDPLFSYEHGEAMAEEIPDATLVPLPGMGHQVPPRRLWDVVVPAVLRHTSGGQDREPTRSGSVAAARAAEEAAAGVNEAGAEFVVGQAGERG